MDNISFFVSSTFKDMQGERDALHRVVIPELREFARGYGRSVDFIDLRWGISTDDMEGDESSDKILSVCLDEIELCSPYQIVILGERYGWMPSPRQLARTANAKSFPLESDAISVTELEILYGMYKNAGMLDRCIFCLRDPLDPAQLTEEERRLYISEDEGDRKRMRLLKEKICAHADINVIRYSLDLSLRSGRYDDFTKKLTARIYDILKNEWGEQKRKSWILRQEEEDRMLSRQLCSRFTARTQLMDTLEDHLSTDFLVPLGENGCGMSSIAAKLGERLREKGSCVRNVYCGNAFCSDTEQLIKIMYAQIAGSDTEEELSAVAPQTGRCEYWKEKWDEAAASYDGEKIYFLIDGIHHLDADASFERSDFLPSKGCSRKISFFITSNYETAMNPIAVEQMNRWCDFYDVGICSEDDLRAIITSRLRAEHKQIGEKVMQALLSHPLISNMICMELILQDVLNLNGEDFARINKLEKTVDGNTAISNYLCNVVRSHPTLETELISYWLLRSVEALSDFDEEEKKRLLCMMSFFAGAMSGLSSDELSDLADYLRTRAPAEREYSDTWWEEVRFVRLRQYLGPMLRKTAEGRYTFAHEQIRSGVFADSTVRSLGSVPVYWYKALGESSRLSRENFLPSVLMYLARDKTEEKCKKELKNEFIHRVASVYALSRSEDKDIAAEGSRNLAHTMRGLRRCLICSGGENRTRLMCDLLKGLAKSGVPIQDDGIAGLFFGLDSRLKSADPYEQSIKLSMHIALARGYAEWETSDGRYPAPKLDDRLRKSELGVYKEWTRIQRRGLALVYTDACKLYYDLRYAMADGYRLVKPDWEWSELRDKTAHYLNLFASEIDTMRNHYCSQISLMDADLKLPDDPVLAYYALQRAETFNKSLIGGIVSGKSSARDFVMRHYVNDMMDTVNAYILLARINEGMDTPMKSSVLGFFPVELCQKTVRKLKWKRFIKKPVDLEPSIRVKYLTTYYYAQYFNTASLKQSYVDTLWAVLKECRACGEWMKDRTVRDEIMRGDIRMMECLLDGWYPSEYQKDGKTVRDFARFIVAKEGTYMLACDPAQRTPEMKYRLYLIRALCTLFLGETEADREYEAQERRLSIAEIEKYLDSHREQTGEYLFRLKRILEWNRDFKD